MDKLEGQLTLYIVNNCTTDSYNKKKEDPELPERP